MGDRHQTRSLRSSKTYDSFQCVVSYNDAYAAFIMYYINVVLISCVSGGVSSSLCSSTREPYRELLSFVSRMGKEIAIFSYQIFYGW